MPAMTKRRNGRAIRIIGISWTEKSDTSKWVVSLCISIWPGNREFVTTVANDMIRLQKNHNIKRGLGHEALQAVKRYANH